MQVEHSDKKRILYIFNDTGFGGAGQSLLDTLVDIKGEIIPIVIIQDFADVEDKFSELGIKCYKIHFYTDYVKIGRADADKRKRDVIQSYEAALQLLPIIQKEKIQLIHINSSVSYFAAIAALMAKVPFVWHIRELMEEQFGCEFLNPELKIDLYKRADRIIAISDYVQKIYFEKYGIKTYKLYDGLNVGKFRSANVNKNFNNTFIVAAMITPEKGQWDVIRAAKILVEKGYDDFKVAIVGSGEDGYVWALKKYIHEKKLEKHITIISFQKDLSLLRSQASYAITSSKNEALGRVTIESMLAGNVVIGAASGATTEIINENEERGFLYELGNSESLAHVMEKVMNCECKRKCELIQRALKYAEDTFDSKQYCRKLVKIYDDILVSFRICDNKKVLDKLAEYYDAISNFREKITNESAVPYRKSALMLPFALKWIEIRQNGHLLDEYFQKNKIENVAIYGLGLLGRRLYDELENSNIRIKYLIDRNPNGLDRILKFVSLDKEKLEVDVIVVTVISEEKNIIDEIKTLGYENVVGLSEIINSFDNIDQY